MEADAVSHTATARNSSKENFMRVSSFALAGLFVSAATLSAVQVSLSPSAPETFTANAQVKSGNGTAAATIEIHIQRYTPDFDRKSVETALKSGGYPAFLTALRKAPDVGYVASGENKWTIRYARERAADKGPPSSLSLNGRCSSLAVDARAQSRALDTRSVSRRCRSTMWVWAVERWQGPRE